MWYARPQEKEQRRNIPEENAEQNFTQAVVPPIRERLGDHNRSAIPLTYPGKRKHPRTLDDRGAKKGQLSKKRLQDWREWTLANRKRPVPKGPRQIPQGYDD